MIHKLEEGHDSMLLATFLGVCYENRAALSAGASFYDGPAQVVYIAYLE